LRNSPAAKRANASVAPSPALSAAPAAAAPAAAAPSYSGPVKVEATLRALVSQPPLKEAADAACGEWIDPLTPTCKEAYDAICAIKKMTDEYYDMDGDNDYWTISTEMIEPISRWIYGEDMSVICQEHEIFEGNMMRALFKITSILEEWLTMAMYCQHTEEIDKIMGLKERMKMVQADSLYLRL
jgi:superfamily II RNA helicase